ESIWDQYLWYIIGALAIFALQTAMIADLLLHRRRRRRAEAELLESRQLMELATEAGGIGLWVRDMLSGKLWANPRVRSLFGFASDGTLGVGDILAHVHSDDRARVVSVVERAQETGDPFEAEFRTAELTAAPGRWIAARGQAVRDAQGQILRRMGTMVDITERKQAEERLRESEENFRRLVESTSAVIWQANMDSWMFTYVGPQAVKFLGYPLEQWYEKDFWASHIHPDDRERAINTCLTLSKDVEEFEFEYRMIRISGEIVWVHDIVNCQQQAGKPKELRGLMLDITGRKRIEQALLESEERFRNMADSAPVMIWMAGTDKLCNYFNNAWLDFTGRSMALELGNGWAEGVHPDDFRSCLDTYMTAFDAREPFRMEYRLRRHDGEYRWIVDDGLPRYRPDQTFDGYIGSCLDITERKLAEERFRLAVEASPSAIAMINPKGEIMLVNALTEKLFGYSREELIGKSVEVLVPDRFRADHPAHRGGFFAAPQSRSMGAGRDLFAKRKDGSEFQVEIGLNPIQTNEGMLVLTAIVDITERKRAESELRHNREELAHVTRITAMGELAASLAHELNQPLTAILSNAQAAQRFLANETAEIDEVRDILRDIVEDNNRASEVIRRMRALVKKEKLAFSGLDFAGLTREIVALIHSDAILRNVRVDVEVGPDVPLVRGDKIQLQQVLLNLLLNAFDAMKDCPAEEREVAVRIESKGGARVDVSVSDRGSGLTIDKLDKIFEPFFTTKREGLGMGLSISRSIIEAHGGHLWARNNPARGATFHFTLPLDDDRDGDRQARQTADTRSSTW
ncbi:MAG TPA: PAS domain S-box protein, partial [Candidatus Binatia bacterium]|nr:PAS domain S-box protein [Candidatus Binatia bacterium]